MEYSGGDLVDLGEKIQNCLDELTSPFIYLWSPNRGMGFDEAKVQFLDTENFPQPIPLQEATGMDVNTFYQSIIDFGNVCVETPKELWL